ncbi:hypothetical protein R1flu_023807 [Riccia fluitans]|uniref:AMP-activated protein kinase glycogen-binding domain-containing protein n=1 Tax=Riccia fluitans TaxID=41844 RepID=A0ABD1XTK1_9MARC
MAAMSLEFAWTTFRAVNNCGEGRVGCRMVSSILGKERVAFGYLGTKDDGNSGIRLVWVASVNPSGSSSKQPKASAKSRRRSEGPSESDLKLVRELKEFINTFDLPPTEVPTTKELMRNGRQDLANAVRRRGYKTVAGLLGFALEVEAAGIYSVDVAKGIEFRSTARYVSEHGVLGNSSGDVQQMSNTGDDESEVLVPVGGGGSRSLSPGILLEDSAKSNGFASHTENDFRKSSAGTQALAPGVLSPEQVGHLGRTFRSKRGDHIQRQLNLVKGGGKTFDLLQNFDVDTEGKNDNFEEDGEVSPGGYTEDEHEDDDEDDEDDGSSIEGPVAHTDARFDSVEDIAAKKAAILRSRILEYFDSRKGDSMKPETIQDGWLPRQVALEQEDSVVEAHKKDVELESSQRLEGEKELERIRNLLREREEVLAEVTKELEEAKAQFSLARAKATAELVHATQLAAEREARLQAAEGALSSLKQVHLEWWGEAKHVELAGTFNGWQHRILMEPDPTSEIPKPDGSRGQMMWGTHLYLYPGVYEIKFIIDGNWQLDHRREVVMRHGNQNNVLRVEL